MRKSALKSMLVAENDQLQKLNNIVLKAIEEEKLLSEKLMQSEDTNPSFANRLADTVASFGGSWRFIMLFLTLMLGWIAVNLYMLGKPFDPYPFILLNLVLSTVAALQAPIIMMSQNRKEERDRKRSVNDYLVNLKAEVEIRNIHEKLDLLMAEQMKTLFEIQQEQMRVMDDIRSLMISKNSIPVDLKGKKKD